MTKGEVCMIKSIIKRRRLIHGIISAIVIGSAMYLNIGIGIILILGMITGVIFGKVFCRWMCPLGFVMESLLGTNKDTKNIQMYNYHKMGCPIAWVSGIMNRFSFFKIKKDTSKCVNCGICDSNCYIATLNSEYSVYDEKKQNSTTQFSCSKCLACVGECPTGSLKYTFKK